MTMSRTRTATALTAVALAATVLSACSSADQNAADASTTAGHGAHSASSSAPSSAVNAAYNDTDVNFATMMYPHHAQAIDMANLVDGKDASADVVALAAEIKGAQQPEMDAFTRLLASWGKPAPKPTMDHAMDGMMTDAQMDRLKSLRGTDFDREWLTMMIQHHRGAISMADTELASGVNAETRQIATDIKSGQQAEIDRMQKLLG
ncbi:DUF305 domain-containing protein [Tsukamurella strandjordii]|uniref:DUF305 domain-containing protein n=1 Tax=Tsukamurella strandjordii TaxID=147577 RepID=UPI0031E14390